MTRVNVQEAKTRLSQLLAAAERGEEVVIARGGRPVVRLVPVEEPGLRPGGSGAGPGPRRPRRPAGGATGPGRGAGAAPRGLRGGLGPRRLRRPAAGRRAGPLGVSALLLDTHALLWTLLGPGRRPGAPPAARAGA